MSSPEESHALESGAGIGSIEPRSAIGVAGKDRASYLQGLLTNDILALSPGTGCYAAWLTPQGRMLTDLHVFESGDMILLDLPVEQHAATLARLEQFLFSEDVQLSDLADTLVPVWIHGPAAAASVQQITTGLSSLAIWTAYQNGRTQIGEAAVVVARIDQLGVPGFCLYVEPSRAPAVVAALEQTGAVRLSAAMLEGARIDAGYPLFGADMTSDTIPLEAGIEARAISLTKGCYVGQEIIIRVLHRGQGRVARKLVSLSIDDAVPTRGAAILAGEKQVGSVTSAARSFRRGPVAMGYLHRDLLTVGTVVDVDIDGHRCAARVTAVAGW
jgi:folate-binding protein YgfZ